MVLPLLAAAGRVGLSALGSGLMRGISSLFGGEREQPSGSAQAEIPTLEPITPTPNLVPIQTVNQSPSSMISNQIVPQTKTNDGRLDYLISITEGIRSKVNLLQSQIKSINSNLVDVGKNVQSSSERKEPGPIRSAIKLATSSFAGAGLTAAGLGTFAAFLNAPDKPVSQQIDDIREGRVSPESLTSQIDSELGIEGPTVFSAAGQQLPTQSREQASKRTIENAINDSPRVREVVQELEKAGIQVDKSRSVNSLSEYITRLAFKGQENVGPVGPQSGSVNTGSGQQLPVTNPTVRNLRYLESKMETSAPPTLVTPSNNTTRVYDPDKHGPSIESIRPEPTKKSSESIYGLQLEPSKIGYLGPSVTEPASVKLSTQSIAENSTGQMRPTIVQPIINNTYSGGGSGGQQVINQSGSSASVRVAYNTPADFKSYSPSLSGVI